MQWTSSNNLRSREAAVVGGPLNGLRVMVAPEPSGGYRWPDVFDFSDYVFHPSVWQFAPVGWQPGYHGDRRA